MKTYCCQNHQTRELITYKVTALKRCHTLTQQQQRLELPTLILTWHMDEYKVHKPHQK